MEFYDMLGKYYDVLFPPSKAQIDFLSQELEPCSKVLDIGCATGGYALTLAEAGHKLTAADLDEKMILQLKEEISRRDLEIETCVLDLRNISQLEGEFDMIYCIGNTLVHLNDLSEVSLFVKDAYDKLKPGGKLVIQSVNYDRVLRDNVQNLPEINREEPCLKFVRSYQQSEGTIRFRGELTLKEEDHEVKWQAETRLLPILKADMMKIFDEVGFSVINCFGDFNKSTFTFESPALVTLTIK